MPPEPAKTVRPAKQWILLWPLAALGLLLLFNCFSPPAFFILNSRSRVIFPARWSI